MSNPEAASPNPSLHRTPSATPPSPVSSKSLGGMSIWQAVVPTIAIGLVICSPLAAADRLREHANEIAFGVCGETNPHFKFPAWRVPRVKGLCLFDEPEDRDHRQADCVILIQQLDRGGAAQRQFTNVRGEFDFGSLPPGRYLLVACSNGGSTYYGLLNVDQRAKARDLRLYLKWMLPPPPGHGD